MNTKEIKAETLILQTDVRENFNVCMQGVFSRNFGEDLIKSFDDDDQTIFEISRNGVFHLLPEGLFFEENRLRTKSKEYFMNKYDAFKEEEKKIKSFFTPFDTVAFKLCMEMEKKLNALAEKGNIVFADGLWEEFGQKTDNEYLNQLKFLLPFLSQLRGNHELIADILKNVLAVEKVEVLKMNTLHMRFMIYKRGLDTESYQKMDEEIAIVMDFIRQWFLPIEVEYDYRLKHKESFTLGNIILLDYNTYL